MKPQTAVTSTNSDQHDETILMPEVSHKPSDNQNAFEDDDELFMNVEVDAEKLVQKPAPMTVVKTNVPRITTTVSKRVKYENSSSSDEDTSSKGECDPSDPSSRPRKSDATAAVRPVGIRKRNIF